MPILKEHTLPELKTKRTIGYNSENDLDLSGIYQINIGGKFYIGRASNIKKRLSYHISTLNSCLNGNYKKTAQEGILNVLLSHPDINTLQVELLQECESEIIEVIEDYWLYYYRNIPAFLNVLTYKNKHKMILENLIDRYVKEDANFMCVYRLSYASKYLIVKGKTLTGSLFLIKKGFPLWVNKAKKQEALYHHFYQHFIDNPKRRFTCKVLLKTEDYYELLKREQTELDKSRYNPNCLNNSMESYIPLKNDLTGNYGWIPEMAVRSFQKYLKSKKRSDWLRKYSK